MTSRDNALPMERPAVFFFLALAAGLVIGDRFPGHLNVIFCGSLATGVVFRLRASGHIGTLIGAAAVLLVLGYVSLQPWVDPHLAGAHIKFRADGSRGVITGRVGGLPQRYGSRTRMVLDVETCDLKPACGKLKVTVAGRGPDIHPGDRLRFPARIKSIRNFSNPGAFDYRRHLMFQKVWASAWVSADRVRVLEPHPGARIETRLAKVRATLSSWIRTTLGKRTGGIISALVTGDRAGITPQLRRQFNRLGIGHLLAISGLHIGIIATVSFSCFSWLCRRIDWLANTGHARRAAALLTILPVVAYGLVAGMAPSTQRAVIMVATFLVATMLERQPEPLNTLAAAALIIVVLHPPALFSVSFQLSFTAVFTIIYGLTCLPEGWLWLSGHPESPSFWVKLGGHLAGFFWVSFFAIVGTLPLTMHYFNQVSHVGLLTNFIFIPVVGFVTVPLALAAALLFPAGGVLADGLLKAAGFVLSRAMALADYLNGFNWISTHTVTLTWFEMVCFYSLMILGLQFIKSRDETAAAAGPGSLCHRGRSGRALWIGLAGVAMLVAGDTAYWFHQRFWHRDLRVTCMDVRQGSAALLEFPGGKTMLIDGGGYADNTVFDVGARVVAPLLWQRKILTVDTLVLSHPNSDHLNGLLFISENFNVEEIWTNGEAAKTAGYRKLKKIIRERGIRWAAYQDLPRYAKFGGVTISRLYPPDDFLARQPGETWRNTNNNSMVLRVAQKGTAFLFTGDIMAAAEDELVRSAGSRLRSTVLWVPHHGSKSSSTAGFLNTVAPKVAVISAGRGNWYGFPHPEVLERLQAVGAQVYRTDRDGAITLSAGAGELQIETTLEEGAGF